MKMRHEIWSLLYRDMCAATTPELTELFVQSLHRLFHVRFSPVSPAIRFQEEKAHNKLFNFLTEEQGVPGSLLTRMEITMEDMLIAESLSDLA
jgi:hypothetical protein